MSLLRIESVLKRDFTAFLRTEAIRLMTNSSILHLTPEAKQNLVDFFVLLQDIEKELELEKRLSADSLTQSQNG